jgi:hypothetical protein
MSPCGHTHGNITSDVSKRRGGPTISPKTLFRQKYIERTGKRARLIRERCLVEQKDEA